MVKTLDEIAQLLTKEQGAYTEHFKGRTGLPVTAIPVAKLSATDVLAQWTMAPGKLDQSPPAFYLRLTLDPATGRVQAVAGQRDGDGAVVREVADPDFLVDGLYDPTMLFSWVGKVAPRIDVEAVTAELEELLGTPQGLAC